MDMMKLVNINIAFDNAGGAVLVSKTYAHDYNSGKQLATDVQALLDGCSTSTWDGNDEELLAALDEKEMNRYERVYKLTEIAELLSSEDENTCVGVDVEEKTVSIFWGGGGRPQSGTGYMEYEFWAALLAEETVA